jgi:two-component system nitrate/nitrite response regulator NarL
MAAPVTVVLVDDHPVVLEGVRSWIDADPDRRLRVVHTTASVADSDSWPTADVAVVDLLLGGRLVISEIPRLVAAGWRVVAFSGHLPQERVPEVLRAGAVSLVPKAEAREHLVEAVLAAAADRPYVTRSLAGGILSDVRPTLSQQERRALRLWFQGMSKASVARRMNISEHTVRQYINRARVKYAALGRDAPSKDALLARAIEDALIDPADVRVYRSQAFDDDV